MKKSYDVVDNPTLNRFEIHEEGHIAYEKYERFEGGIAYVSTFVPEALGGRGIASFLVKYVLDDAIAKGLKIKPVCPVVKGYIEKHPEYQQYVIE
ncbi:N-acetyltransferase [Rodentibacter rarus]|uniref:N-acetyltransferase n=1 Tax=Rodentibacter rarus TaxID=1908260 RepID=A0A1V3IL71_9PAST|nr:GNAT family N-acetyltransferase [Rodentibacter rarus]OOF42668.1 N-acetyltransferase [Rodentibacter rarus]